jgi:hypothetical protein
MQISNRIYITNLMGVLITLSLLFAAPGARTEDCNATNGSYGGVIQQPIPCACTTITISPKYEVPVWLDTCTGENFWKYGTANGPGMTNGLVTVITTVTTNTCVGDARNGFYCTDPSGISSITTNSVQANPQFLGCDCGG